MAAGERAEIREQRRSVRLSGWRHRDWLGDIVRCKLTGPLTPGNLASMLPTSRSPRVLAAVLNWCAEKDSAACVSSLMADSSAKVDVLIVDNASPDGSGDRLHASFPQHPFMQTGANLGYAGGNLRAIEWALERDFEYVLIVNDDAEVMEGCIGTLLAAMEATPGAGAAAPLILHHGTSIVWFDGGEMSEFKAMGSHTHAGETLDVARLSGTQVREVTFLSGCVMLLRVETLRACGGFRAEFFAYVEDLELSYRFRQEGWALLQVPLAVATHKVPFPSAPDSAFAIHLRDLNRRRLVSLHYSPAKRLAFMAWFYPTRLIHLARFIAKGDRARISAIWSGMVDRV
ncbi:MAG: glycosyltransferase family 2 protein [Gemmatimonadaceae bacterium]